MTDPIREPLAQLPTPLEFAPRLSKAWGGPNIWIKRDDLTGFGLSGNKVRKLEYQLGEARAAGTTTLITCGAVQSNHCRATAVAAARLGLRCVLLLRSSDGAAPAEVTGNHLLQRLAGAEVRFITPAQYQERDVHLRAAADELTAAGETVRVIPEGASDRLGMIAFAAAVDELGEQVDRLINAPVTIWHASSSAGTTSGMAMGAAQRAARGGSEMTVVGSSVGDPADYLRGRVKGLLAEWTDGPLSDPEAAPFEIVDDYIGGGYGTTTDEELTVQVDGTRLTGMIWDPTYTGKALFALHEEIRGGRFASTDHVVFWHTGGGFAAFAHDFSSVLDPGGAPATDETTG